MVHHQCMHKVHTTIQWCNSSTILTRDKSYLNSINKLLITESLLFTRMVNTNNKNNTSKDPIKLEKVMRGGLLKINT